ncbi:hypothetical protein BN1051_03033 [Arthrobacter saudimassiliensis]|uniref:Lipoprotein n=1 Tax=Arthrobacter saudimassiliensis TaxID=1461584 RepID=A0A078MXY5_9MICC|nr:hypothetical protein BN1051_03033 [Arthrobacter saudimassiliensis]
MTRVRSAAVPLVLLLGLTGCAEDSSEAAAVDGLPWQEAKARAQAVELEIANSFPKDKVAAIDQGSTGVLMGCGPESVNWKGATTVTLNEGVEPEPLVRELETKYQGSRFDIETRTAPAGHYEVGLVSPNSAEIYLVAEGLEPHTIRVASGSDCFHWPEGEYMGGKF